MEIKRGNGFIGNDGGTPAKIRLEQAGGPPRQAAAGEERGGGGGG